MGEFARKRFDEADETRSFDHGKGYVVHLAGSSASLGELEPGWSWSADVKPIAGTDSCQFHHVGYALEGTLHVLTNEGEEHEINAGDAYEILPGHDAWVVGDQTYRALEFQSETAAQLGRR
ncbi:MAG: cupin domain-containing protein [Actinomycetota bacterium]|nr:cupin domain-containing protein [Actinomycetota bacterium]